MVDGKTEEVVNISSMEENDEKRLFGIYARDRSYHIRNIIFNRYVYLVEILAKKYVNRGVEYQDLFQIASIGLINAIERFDVEKGYRFSSFATPTILGEIEKYFRDKEWVIRVPRQLQKLSKRIYTAREELEQRLNRQPNIAELAEYLGITEEKVLEAMEAASVYTPQSIDQPYNNDENKDLSLGDLLGVDDDNLTKIENRDFIDRCISNLNQRELKVLKDRFFKGRTQAQIAKELNVSQMTISRLEKKIVEKFRKQLEA
jgi:RNA polymerase sigma-B factor